MQDLKIISFPPSPSCRLPWTLMALQMLVCLHCGQVQTHALDVLRVRTLLPHIRAYL